MGRPTGGAQANLNAFSGWGATPCGKARRAWAAQERARKQHERLAVAQERQAMAAMQRAKRQKEELVAKGEAIARRRQRAKEAELQSVLTSRGDEYNASAEKNLLTFLGGGAMLHRFRKGMCRVANQGKWGKEVTRAALRKLKRSPLFPISQHMATAAGSLESIRRPLRHVA